MGQISPEWKGAVGLACSCCVESKQACAGGYALSIYSGGRVEGKQWCRAVLNTKVGCNIECVFVEIRRTDSDTFSKYGISVV